MLKGMDLDLAQVRAFVEVAEQLHFGRAAARLFLTQQALSKRIQRLEHTIGEPLFLRSSRGVELTAAGQRFLPYARQLLAAADTAAHAARPAARPLRVDVWGHVQAPLRLVRRLLAATPELSIELSMRRSLASALEAVDRGELDACFGRINDLEVSWPAGLTHRPALLERCMVAVGADHPLADAAVVDAAALRNSAMWCVTNGSSAELVGWWHHIGQHLGVHLETSGNNLGLEHCIDQLKADPTLFATFGVDWAIREDAGIRIIPIDPAPCYLWSLIWREASRHPLLPLLLESVGQAGDSERLLSYDAEHDWLPDVDLADLRQRHVAAAGARERAPMSGPIAG